MSSAARAMDGFVPLVDAHVHVYDCYRPETLLDSACVNFKTAAAAALPPGQASTGMLLLSESVGCQWFAAQAAAGAASVGDWQLSLLPDEALTLMAHRGDDVLYIVAGRQVVTGEGLEVLALMTTATFPDGMELCSLLAAIDEAGGGAVIPWAVGKWLGRRGRLLMELLENPGAAVPFYLGDNGGRPVFWRNPRHFQRAERAGIRILPGSDPLPLPGDASRVASYGFTVPGRFINRIRPAAGLRDLLRDPAVAVQPYGALESPLRFFRNQLALRRRKGTA